MSDAQADDWSWERYRSYLGGWTPPADCPFPTVLPTVARRRAAFSSIP
jgi:hypothetical protein